MNDKPKLPVVIIIRKERYRAVVLRIQNRYEDGTPEDLTLIKDDMVCELSEDVTKNEFVIAYIPEKMTEGSEQ